MAITPMNVQINNCSTMPFSERETIDSHWWLNLTLIGMEGIVQKSKNGGVSIKIVEVDDDGREVFEVQILTIYLFFFSFFSSSLHWYGFFAVMFFSFSPFFPSLYLCEKEREDLAKLYGNINREGKEST